MSCRIPDHECFNFIRSKVRFTPKCPPKGVSWYSRSIMFLSSSVYVVSLVSFSDRISSSSLVRSLATVNASVLSLRFLPRVIAVQVARGF